MITIIGAGISGLSLAWHLQKQGKAYRLLEASSRVGGYIGTKIENGHVLDLGPNSLMADTDILNFLDDLGLSPDIMEATAAGKNRYIYKNGSLRLLPSGPLSLLSNSYFSAKAKWSILTEAWKKSPSQQDPNETLSHFFERRFNKEIVDYALDPFVMGIYAGSPDQLLTEMTFPSLHRYEKEHGSVLKGLIKNTGKRKHVVNFLQGMQQLTDTIARQLKHLHLNTPVESVEYLQREWTVHSADTHYSSSHLVFATPAHITARLLKTHFPSFSQDLEKIDYPPMVAVHSIYKRNQVKHALNGFGSLSPAAEKQLIAGCIWASSVFPYKCGKDEILLTSMTGGTRSREVIRSSDQELKEVVHQELVRYFQISGQPLTQQVIRWEKAIPQYDINLKKVWEQLPEFKKQQLDFCVNWYEGVSLPDCIRKGRELAEILP